MAKDTKDTDKRLGRMTVFRGLAGDKAIEATSAEVAEAAAEVDSDAGGHANDSDAGARRGSDSDQRKKPRATDVD